MKKQLVFLAAATLASAQAMAAPIDGVIAFTGTFTDNVDTTTGNGTLDFANVTQYSVARTGDFTDLTGDFFGVAFGPISITANAVDLPVNPVWALNDGLGVSTSFILDTVSLYTNDSNGVAIDGFGDLSLTGYDTTRGKFTLDTAANKLTFDADAASVSSPGTMALLGFGLVGLGLARRNQRKG